MGIAPLAFTGVSKFSEDFQTILRRSVQIASLPIQHLQTDQARLVAQRSAFSELSPAVSDLATSLNRLAEIAERRSISVVSSSGSVSATVTGAASAGTYVITGITSLAKRALATSASGYADTNTTEIAGSENKLYLVVGGVTTEIALTDGTDNLAGVRDAINAAGAGVVASILDTGQSGNPFYLSLTASETGLKNIELRTVAAEPGSSLLSQTNPGANAAFTINGQPVTRSSNLIEGVIDGVQIELNATTGPAEEITLEVKSDVQQVTAALDHFARTYNALTARLDRQVGEKGGILTGASTVRDLSRLMRLVTGHRGTGAIQSLADLGITLAKDGTMSVDTSAVRSLTGGQLGDLFQFLGAGASGLGQYAASFEAYSDEASGFIENQLQSIEEADKRISDQIAALTERVSAMQTTMMARLQAADTLLARLESQRGLLDASLESLNAVAFGKRKES